MKNKIFGLTAAFILLTFLSGSQVYCGVIPYSLIENDQKKSEPARQDILRKKHLETLKKLSDLNKEEGRCLEELAELDKSPEF